MTGLVAGEASLAPAPSASAATAANFNPGLIISDQIFYDRSTMTVDQIQAFLNAKEASCYSGYTCLKNYYETTRTRTADSYCAGYAGQNESAARIIYKVASACGINPQVLLATLEKEQGLVTSTAPGSYAYRSAMGYGCPDTAPCDAQYYGFYNQVYKAAWQFKVYQRYPTSFNFVAGRNNTILWNPNSACGTSQVYIQNQATAGLYNYTPYRPNAKALANLYGTGDSCSSYGNRNFWRIFTDWFGSTSIGVDPRVQAAWVANGGATGGRLGLPVSAAVALSGGGVMQKFQYGWLIYRSDLGTFRLTGATADYFFSHGSVTGNLGYPISDVAGADAVEHVQDFEFGHLSWKPNVGVTVTGGYRVSGVFLTNYYALKASKGVLGYPLGAQVAEGSGWISQQFEDGRLLYDGSKKIMYWVPTALWNYWKSKGGLTGAIGTPVKSPSGSAAAGWSQDFSNGRLAVSSTGVVSAVGGFAVSGIFGTNWNALKASKGVLGYPLGAQVAEGSGWISQQFEDGRLLYDGSKKIMYWVPTALWNYWKSKGGLTGAIGTPVKSPSGSAAAGWSQDFSNGRLAVSSTGVVSAVGGFAVSGIFGTNWNALKASKGVLGYPLGAQVAEGSGWISQQFEDGRLLYDGSKKIMYWVPTALWNYWKSKGGLTGAIGTPVKSPSGSAAAGWSQDFSNGRLAVSSTGVVSAVGGFAVSGIFGTNWNALKASKGVLGYPLGAQVAEGSGWISQQFEDGRLLYDGSKKIMYWVPTALWNYWKSKGGLTGAIGTPVKSPSGSAAAGWSQDFSNGRLAVVSGAVTFTPSK